MTIIHTRDAISRSGRAALKLGLAAAASCALTVNLPACSDAARKAVVVKPSGPDASTSTIELTDGSVPDGSAQPERCVVRDDYLAQHRACSMDADCALLSYQISCCPDADRSLVAVTRSDLEELQACVDSSEVMCACQEGLTRAEDGRVVSESSPAIARCVDQKCMSAIGERACGSLTTCGAHEICVTYENVAGGFPPDPDSPDNKLLTFRCVPNPCQGRLNCECVQPICDARDDVARKCEIERNGESDVTCVASHE